MLEDGTCASYFERSTVSEGSSPAHRDPKNRITASIFKLNFYSLYCCIGSLCAGEEPSETVDLSK